MSIYSNWEKGGTHGTHWCFSHKPFVKQQVRRKKTWYTSWYTSGTHGTHPWAVERCYLTETTDN